MMVVQVIWLLCCRLNFLAEKNLQFVLLPCNIRGNMGNSRNSLESSTTKEPAPIWIGTYTQGMSLLYTISTFINSYIADILDSYISPD
jgi:hypothetical protein